MAIPPVPVPKKDIPPNPDVIKKLLLKPTRTDQEDEILKMLVAKLAEDNPQALADIIHRWLSENQ